LIEKRAKQVVFDGRELYAEEDTTFCICGKKENGRQMLQCGQCLEWYHLDCIGMEPKDVPKGDYKCHYHDAPPDKGKEKWNGNIPQKKNRATGQMEDMKLKLRDVEKHASKMKKRTEDDKKIIGFRNWEDLMKHLDRKAEEFKRNRINSFKRAGELLESQDHHLLDRAGGQLPLVPEVVDYLQGQNLM
jgi:hypothetical protein